MKPRICKDRFGPGWLCKLRGTFVASGVSPASAYAMWRTLNRVQRPPVFPAIDPSLLPEKENTHAQ